MYVLALYFIYSLALYRIITAKFEYTKEGIADLILWSIIGILFGGRLGYVLFYNPPVLLLDTLSVVLPFTISDGFRHIGIFGMSYHGGAVGVLRAALFFCRARKINFWQLVDFFRSSIPAGYFFLSKKE